MYYILNTLLDQLQIMVRITKVSKCNVMIPNHKISVHSSDTMVVVESMLS